MRRIACRTERLVEELRSASKEGRDDAAAVAEVVANCLIVEDDDTDAELSLQAVEAVGGVRAERAKTGDDAISLLRETLEGTRPRFHIVFLDLQLVGSAAQGYHVMQFIRRNLPKTHVIIVSGHVDQGVLNLIAGDCYVGIIRKPLHKANLKDILAKHRFCDEVDDPMI